MRIGDVALSAGTTTKAVRFYESVGLLPAPNRSPNGYRDYTSADAERLRLLVGLRSLDLPLARAGELAVLCQAGHCNQVSVELRELIALQRAEVRRRAEELGHLDTRLATLERHLSAGEPPQSVIPREGGLRWQHVTARVDGAAGVAPAVADARARATAGSGEDPGEEPGGQSAASPGSRAALVPGLPELPRRSRDPG